MDKNFLGLGVIFNVIDKGFDQGLTRATAGLNQANEAVNRLGEASEGSGKKGGIFSGLEKGMKWLSIGKIGGTMENIQSALTGGKDIDQTFKDLDTLRTRLGQALDSKVAQRFNDQLMSTKRQAGLTAQETSSMAMGMMEFGRSAEDTIKSLPMMGKLVGVLGMGAEEVSNMFGQGLARLRATPAQMSGLIKNTVKMQKAYKLTDLVSPLPDLFSSVTQNAAMFGKVQSEAAIKSVQSLTGLTASFQKVGYSQKEAADAAIGFNDKLGSMRSSILDMQVGLEPADKSIFKFAEALTMAGFSGDEAFQMIMDSAESPDKLITDLQGRMGELDEQAQLSVTRRLSQIFGDTIANQVGAYREEAMGAVKAAEVQGKGLGTAESEFNKFAGAMGGTVAVQERLKDASKENLELMLKFATKDELVTGLNAQAVAWDAMAKSAGNADSTFGKALQTMQLLKDVGLVGLSPALAPISVMLEKLSDFIFPLATLMGFAKLAKGPLSVLTGIISGLAVATIALAGAIGAQAVALIALGLAAGATYLVYKKFDMVKETVKSDIPDWITKWMSGSGAGKAVSGEESASSRSLPAGSVPTMIQEGAPGRSAMGASVTPASSPVATDINFQSVASEIRDMKDELSMILSGIAGRPVNVEIKGDARKFFSAANREAMSSAGSLGMAGAVTR